MKTILAIVLALSAMQFSARPTRACSVQETYEVSRDVARARIVFSFRVFGRTWTFAKLENEYKGCARTPSPVVITSGGEALIAGQQYLLSGEASAGAFAIGACGATNFADLSPTDLNWLATRTNCCGEACKCGDGSEFVECFADPCQTTTCSDASSCVANYCGGCNAEFYNQNGEPICTACTQNSDCASDQQCLNGQCHTLCTSDENCDGEHYCLSIYHVCVPWHQVGEYCGDKFGYHRCAPNLTCVITNYTRPYEGVCQH
jgi:hypothetical protein